MTYERLIDIYGEVVGAIVGIDGNILKVEMTPNYMDPRHIEIDDHLEVVRNGVEEIYSIFNSMQEGETVYLTLEKVPYIKTF